MNVLQACFKDSIRLHCIVHKQRNLEEHLKAASFSARKEVLSDIFGVQDGDVFSTGLVDSKDKEAFHKDLLQLQQTLVPGCCCFFFFSTGLIRNKRTPSKGM